MLAGLNGYNLSGGIVRAMEHDACRFRTEVIEQLSESLVLLAYVRLMLAGSVGRCLGTSKCRDRHQDSQSGQDSRRELGNGDTEAPMGQHMGLVEFEGAVLIVRDNERCCVALVCVLSKGTTERRHHALSGTSALETNEYYGGGPRPRGLISPRLVGHQIYLCLPSLTAAPLQPQW